MEIPVYLFTGFLEAGKTKFIQETFQDETFAIKENTLLLVCEEGIEEYDPTRFITDNIYLEIIDNESDLTPDLLSQLQKRHSAERVVIEYNGMWQLSTIYSALPEGWFIYQQVLLCDSATFINYNANMRGLVVDKLNSADLVAFNRPKIDTDKNEFHKIVRGVSRRATILYDYENGEIEYDDIEDPLPFDINADIIEIADSDYALWYRDIAEDMAQYNGKTVSFKGVVLKDSTIQKGNFVCGRHVMTCCVEDIQYNGVVCEWKNSEVLKSYDWVTVTGKISIEKNKLYAAPGPVIKIKSVVTAEPPENKVATFY